MHFKDEGVPKVQVAFQRGEVKVLEESQLMSEKATLDGSKILVFFRIIRDGSVSCYIISMHRCTFYL